MGLLATGWNSTEYRVLPWLHSALKNGMIQKIREPQQKDIFELRCEDFRKMFMGKAVELGDFQVEETICAEAGRCLER